MLVYGPFGPYIEGGWFVDLKSSNPNPAIFKSKSKSKSQIQIQYAKKVQIQSKSTGFVKSG